MKIEKYRHANKSDVKNIVELVNSAYRPAIDSAGWTHESHLVEGDRINSQKVTDILDGKSIILVGIVEDEIVACVNVDKNEDFCYIGMLAVHPAMQSLGYGKQMLEYAEKYSVSVLGINIIKMIVVRNRIELISFYQRRGYIKTGIISDFPLSIGAGKPKVEGLKVEYLVKDIN